MKRRSLVLSVAFMMLLSPFAMLWAAGTGNNVVTPQAFQNGIPTNALTNANGTTSVVVFQSGVNGSLLRGLNVYSTDTSSGTMTLSLNLGGTISGTTVTGGTNYPLVTTVIPIQAGSVTGTPPANLLSAAIFPTLSTDAYGNKVYQVGQIGAVGILTVSMAVAPTSGKVFTVVPINAEDL